jgi:regulator of protease activity HflC (stomatin/prohibitin superfamily)
LKGRACDAIGQSELDLILKDRASINARLLEILGKTVQQWGVMLDAVEIKDLDILEQMQRAIAREAKAIREKRARIIKAEGQKRSVCHSGRNRRINSSARLGPANANASQYLKTAPRTARFGKLDAISTLPRAKNAPAPMMQIGCAKDFGAAQRH